MEPTKLFYTNYTQCLYGVCHDLFNVVVPRRQGSMADYLGKLHDLFHEFNKLLPLASPLAQE